MKKFLWIAAGLLGLWAAPAMAQQTAPNELPGCIYNATPPTLSDKQSVVQQCDTNGQLKVSGTVSATSAATATAANPSYVEGTSNPFSQDLSGHLRVIAGANSGVDIGDVTINNASGASAVNIQDGGNSITVDGTVTATVAAVGATGAAPPASGIYSAANGSGATGGLLAGLKTCDTHAKYDASDTGSITLVTGVSGRKVYVCGYILANGGTATNLKLREGSDANCATSGADLTPAYQVLANQSIGVMSAFWTGLAVSTNAYYICINASAANAHQAEIWYTIQ